MARWQLMADHYLKVLDNEWEYTETSTMTGRMTRKRFPVPRLLDLKDPRDHNYPGMIVVCHEGKGLPNDLVFIGPPTADMEPMDEEAQAISDRESPKWIHPIESLAATGGLGPALLGDLTRQLESAIRNASQAVAPAAPVSMNGVDPEAFAKLQQQVQELMAINAALQADKVKPERDEEGVAEAIHEQFVEGTQTERRV